jgi:hypothetical protein
LSCKAGAPNKGVLQKCLSRMKGNFQVRFLGGKGAERPLTYPVALKYEHLYHNLTNRIAGRNYCMVSVR